MQSHETLLKEIAEQLEDWARESKKGGWSTHQVIPQKKLADRIYAHLYKKDKWKWKDDSQRW